MPIYKINDNQLVKLDETTFKDQDLKERDLQNMLKDTLIKSWHSLHEQGSI